MTSLLSAVVLAFALPRRPASQEALLQTCDAPGVAPGADGTCAAPRMWVLAGRPPRFHAPTTDDFKLQRVFGQPDLTPEQLLQGDLPPGRVELRSLFISVDPTHSQCHKLTPEGNPCMTYTVAEVVRCTAPCPYPVGSRLMSNLFWKEVQIWPVKDLPPVTPGNAVRRIPDELPPGVKLSHYVGVLGMPGWSAYSALFRIGNVTCPGETVFITGAAGVCGAMLGQMAKALGCRVVGTAGSEAKVRRLKEVLGFDEALNYKTLNTVGLMAPALAKAMPGGIDFYFDNTAGHVTTAAWSLLNDGARVAICGGIAHYYDNPPWWHHGVWSKELPLEEDGSDPVGPTPMGAGPVSALSRGRHIKVEGLSWQQLHNLNPYEDEFNERVPAWIANGTLKVDETILEGFERLPEAFAGLFKGTNIGKMVISVQWPDTGKASKSAE